MKNTVFNKTLVIAEKPSVAQDIVRALTPTAGKFEKHDEYFESDTYVVSSAVGHLVEIQAPDEFDVKRGKWSFANLPVIPPHFDLKPVDKTKTRLNAVVKLAKRKDVDKLVNACDAGREGELIFRLIEQYAGGGLSCLCFDELTLFTKDKLFSWNAALSKWVLRGTHLAVTVDETPIPGASVPVSPSSTVSFVPSPSGS